MPHLQLVKSSVKSVFGRQGDVILLSSDISSALGFSDYVRLGQSNTFTLGPNVFQTGGTTNVGVVVKGTASQSANLQEWQDSVGTVKARITKDGYFSNVATPSTGYMNMVEGGYIISGNNQGLISKTSGGSEVTLLKLNSSDETELYAGHTLRIKSGPTNVVVIADSPAAGNGLAHIDGSVAGAIYPVLTLRATASQSANIQEWQNSSGTVLSHIHSDGAFVSTNGYVQVANVYCNSFNDQNTSGAYLNLGDSVPVTINTRSVLNKGLVVKGAASQSANLQEWQDSTGAVWSCLTAAGRLALGRSSASEMLHVLGNAQFDGSFPYISLKPSAWASSAYFNSGTTYTGQTAGNFTLFLNPVGKGFSWNQSTTSLFLINTDGTVGVGATSPGGQLHVIAGTSSAKGLIVQAAASQSANLQEWQNSSGTALASVAADGKLLLNSSGGLALDVQNNSQFNGNLTALSGRFYIANAGSQFRHDGAGQAGYRLTSTGVHYGLIQNDSSNTWSLAYGTAGTTALGLPALTWSATTQNILIPVASPPLIGLVIKGAIGQSANLQEWQNGSGTALSFVDSLGRIALTNGAALGYNSSGTYRNLLTTGNTCSLVSGQDGSTVAMYWNSAGIYPKAIILEPTENTIIAQATGGGVLITNTTTDHTQLIVKATALQTANLQEWQNSAGTALSYIANDGTIYLASAGYLYKPSANTIALASQNSLGRVHVGDVPVNTQGTLAVSSFGVRYINASNTAGLSIGSWSNWASGYFPLEIWKDNTQATTMFSVGHVGQTLVKIADSTFVPLTVKGAASQSANLQEWQDSSASVLASINSLGNLNIGTPTTTYSLAENVIAQKLTTRTALVMETKSGSVEPSFLLLNSSGSKVISMGVINEGGGYTPSAAADIRIGITGTGLNGAGFTLVETTTGFFRTLGWGINNNAAYATAYNAPAFSYDNGSFFQVSSTSKIGFKATSDLTTAGTPDTYLTRSAAGVIQVNGASGISGAIICGCPTLSTIGLTVKAAASQSANLQEWQNSSGTALSYVASNGAVSVPRIGIGAAPNATHTLNIYTGATGGLGQGSIGNIVNSGVECSLYFGNANTSGKWGAYSNFMFIENAGAGTDHGIAYDTADKLRIVSVAQYVWVSTGDMFSGTPDTGLSRSAAGNVGFTNGSSTTYAIIGANGFTSTPAIRTSGSTSYFTVTAPADTTLTASTESIGVSFLGATRQFATGALTNQREYVIAPPTYSFVGASTLTTAATFEISGAPVAGTNATITNAYALRVASGKTWLGDNLYMQAGKSIIFAAGSNTDTAVSQTGVNTTMINHPSGRGCLMTLQDSLPLLLSAGSGLQVALVVRGFASQSANLQEWQNSSGTALTSVASGGYLTFSTVAANGDRVLNINRVSSATLCGAAGPDSAANLMIGVNNADLILNPTSGYTSIGNMVAGTGIVRFSNWYRPGGMAGLVADTVGSTFTIQSSAVSQWTISSSAGITHTIGAAGTVGHIIKAAASQSANLQEWQNSSGTALASVTSTGKLNLPINAYNIPSLAFGGFDTGFSAESTKVGTRINGQQTLLVETNGLRLINSLEISWTATPGGVVGDVGLKRAAAKVIRITDGNDTSGGTITSAPLSPTTLAANQNNYNPGVARRYRLSTDGSGAKSITGLSISQVDGQEFTIVNIGTDSITFTHQDAASTAANRFICTGAANIVLATDEEALAWYDGTTQRFRLRKV